MPRRYCTLVMSGPEKQRDLSPLLQKQIHDLQQAITKNQKFHSTSQAVTQSVATTTPPPRIQALSQSVATTTPPPRIQALSQSVATATPPPRIQSVSQSVEVGGSSSNANPPSISYQYKIRIINPCKKSEVKVRLLHHFSSKFESIDSLKQLLMRQFKDSVPCTTEFNVGFMEGSQQAKIWLANEDDLCSMYEVYKNGGNITLWCDGCS